MNTVNNNTNNAAQLTISFLFTLARKIYQANYKVKHEKKWNKDGLTGVELKGKTLGIIGNKGAVFYQKLKININNLYNLFICINIYNRENWKIG